MSLGRCIPDMVKRGEIDEARGKRMAAIFDELEGYYRRSMGPDAAAAEASEATLRQLRAEALLKKRQVRLQAMRQIEAVRDLDRFSGKSRWQAIEALLDDDDRAAYRGGSVEFKRLSIENDAHRQLGAFIEHHKRNLVGKPNDAAGLDDFGREMFGEDSGNARAKVFAEGANTVFEQLRQRFNAAGGNIRKLDSYGLPQNWDPMLARKVPAQTFVDDAIAAGVKIYDQDSGVPLAGAKLDEVLRGIHETIRTNGLTGEATSVMRGVGKLANRHADHRVMHFDGYDGWKAMNAKYGTGENPFGIVVGHVASRARDIALMERLGPNPDATMRYLTDHVAKERAQSDEAIVGDVAGKSNGRTKAESLYEYIKGSTSMPIVPESRVGLGALRTIQGWRNLATARKLGSATIPALFGDLHTGVTARQAYGLSAISEANNGLMAHLFAKLPDVQLMAGYLKDLTPYAKKDREIARELNAGLQDAAHSIRSLARLHGEATGPGWTQVVADTALRATLMNRVTEAGKNMAFKDVMRQLGRHRDVKWDALPEDLRGAMARSGIDSYDWASIRQAPPLLDNDVAYVNPSAVSRHSGAQDRLMGFALRVQAAAVQESTPRNRAVMSLGQRPGTEAGEAARLAFQFKAIAFGLFMKQRRVIAALPPARRAAYVASFFARAVVVGAMMQQVRELVKGDDPLPMDNIGFWGKSALYSGGLGIVGDLIGQVQDAAYGQRVSSIAGYFAGPVISDSEAAISIGAQAAGLGPQRKDGTMRDPNPGGAAVRAIDTLSPASSNWYLRAAWERMVIDQLRAGLDPHAERTTKRRIQQLQLNRQGQWWRFNDTAPHRAPNMGTAVGQAPEQ